MHPEQFTHSVTVDNEIVWPEAKPAIIGRTSSCEKNTLELDDKTQMLGYYSSALSPIEEDLPPQYDSQETKSQPHIFRSIIQIIRVVFADHLILKVVAVYLFLVYCTASTSLPSPFELSDWSMNLELLRSHSRDFASVGVYELDEDSYAWSRSRLGRVGRGSSLLTFSEMVLVGGVEWEVEPETDLEHRMILLDSLEKSVPSSSKAQQILPLPFRRPSNVFQYSRQLFDPKHQSTHKHASRSSHLLPPAPWDAQS